MLRGTPVADSLPHTRELSNDRLGHRPCALVCTRTSIVYLRYSSRTMPTSFLLSSRARRYGRGLLPVLAGTAAVVGVIAGAFALGAKWGGDRVRARDVWADGRLLSTAIDSVRANALDSLPNDELIRRAVAGMLRELHDPYAALLRSDGYRSYRGSLMGESQGLGMNLRLQGGLLTVRTVAVGSPAAIAGVKRGDRILMWNGVPVDEWRRRTTGDSARTQAAMTQLVLARAPTGDSVRVNVRRATWHMPAVTLSGLITDSVGYVRIGAISQGTTDEVERTTDQMIRRGARALVLDLRGNGGGLFEEGVRTAALFLPKNVVVSSLSGRPGVPPQVYLAEHSRWPALPITVLVDAGTASASEVIAAALREHGRALLVGAPTYGKGVVQRVVRLTPDLSLRLTTARWLTPSGASLQRRQGTAESGSGGLTPDVLLDDASYRDASTVPRDWSPSLVAQAVRRADTVATIVMRDSVQGLPLAVLESRVRQRVLQAVPTTVRDARQRAQWIGTVTQLSVVRALEVLGADQSLLRYTVREDGALRAGLDVVAPGWMSLGFLPTDLAAPRPN